jgi:hypothetical protein
MKKRMIFFGLLVFMNVWVYSQALFDFSIRLNTKIKDGKTLADVEIILNSNNSSINYQLFPEGKIDGIPIKESGFTTLKNFTFYDIPAGIYIIKITDSEKRFSFERFAIKEY